jgi:hypothetical protein
VAQVACFPPGRNQLLRIFLEHQPHQAALALHAIGQLRSPFTQGGSVEGIALKRKWGLNPDLVQL